MPVIITNDFPPTSGGIQRVMSRIAEGVSSRGHDVTVVAPSGDGTEAFDRTVSYDVLRYVAIRQKLLGMLAMVPTYIAAVRRTNCHTTIASVWWPAAVAVALVPKWFRGRFYILAHGSEIAPSRAGLRRHVMRYVYGKADAVFPVSSFAETLLFSVGVHANVRRVSLAVDASRIEPARSAMPTILSVGRLVARKGFDRTIEAVEKLSLDYPDLQYVIVGTGPQKADLERLASTLGIANRVFFRGNLSDAELKIAYSQAWVFSLPTRRIEDDVEGFGLVYLEAAMAELPSIGGRDSGAVDAIAHQDTGYLVDGDDAGQVAMAICRLLADPALRATMGRRACERAKTFTWERTVTQILDVLSQRRP